MARQRPPATLVLDPLHPGRKAEEWEVAPQDLRWLLRSGKIFQHILRHPQARVLVQDLEGSWPPKAILASRLLTRGPAWVEDRLGQRSELTFGSLSQLAAAWLRDAARGRQVPGEAARQIKSLEAAFPQKGATPRFRRDAGVLFLRTDFSRGVTAGGSFAHIAGVLNEVRHLSAEIDLVTTDTLPLLDPSIKVHKVRPERRAWANGELHQLHLNARLEAASTPLVIPDSGRLIYQRYSANNWTGAALARKANLPFILEFNGSAPWVARHWGTPLKYEDLAARIEMFNLQNADLITVVSEPLRQDLLSRGIPEQRILTNPNGVDTERFNPSLDGADVRARHGLGDACVIGFIGTFGPWHGVEILAQAFCDLLARRPDLGETTRLFLIGDGVCMPATREILRKGNVLPKTVLTGIVPQAQGPEYLAACDILVVPTVPNPDGSPFFGSPTKLFECMAVGRALVATPLGQVGEILEHEKTALLVPPSDQQALSRALEDLVLNREKRAVLAENARKQALLRHTWKQHVSCIFERLDALQG